jgi:hypothetical protein
LEIPGFKSLASETVVNGQDPQGNPVIIGILPTLLLAGAHNICDNHAIIDIPGNALPANIDLARLVRIYGR